MEKKKVSSSKKIVIVATILTLLILGGIFSVILVLAATQQNVKSSLKVSYTVDGIAAYVSSNYAIVPTSTEQTITRVPMVCGNEESTEFLVDENTRTANFTQPGDATIELSATSKKVVYEFYIKNLAESMFVIELNDSIDEENMTVRYKASRRRLNTSEYRQTFNNEAFYNLPILDTQSNDREVYIYMSVEVTDLNQAADYEGDLNWTLTKVANNASNLATINLNNDGADGPSNMKVLTPAGGKSYAMPMLYELPTKSGYAFNGYYTKESGEFADKYIDYSGSSEEVCDLSDGTTLYAKIEQAFTISGTTIQRVNEGVKELPVLTVPANVSEIGANAFAGCTQLKEVFFDTTTARPYTQPPSTSFTTIGDGAFSNCVNLEVVHVPDTISYIGTSAFSGCSSLTELTLPTAPTNQTDIGELFGGRFDNSYQVYQEVYDDGWFVKEETNFYVPNSLKKLKILAGDVKAEEIAGCLESCYCYYTSLQEVELVNVSRIKLWSFSGCRNITKLTVLGNPTIEEEAFINFYGLEELVLPKPYFLSNKLFGYGSGSTISISKLTILGGGSLDFDYSQGGYFENCVIGTLELGDGVTKFNGSIFSNSTIGKLIIGKNVTCFVGGVGNVSYPMSGISSVEFKDLTHTWQIETYNWSTNKDEVAIAEYVVGNNISQDTYYITTTYSNYCTWSKN